MLDNSYTLAVDVANNATNVNQVFTRDEEYLNRVIYAHSTSSLTARFLLGFYRQKPIKAGNFLGVAKTTQKITMDITVPGADGVASFTQPLIGEFSLSIPVGATDAQILKMRQMFVTLLDRDDIMVEAQNKLRI